jgi:hypothetical protein
VARERIICRRPTANDKGEEQDQREPMVMGDKLPKPFAAKNFVRGDHNEG